ncbi:hypothetical protein A8B78_19345 [Jannaschia sp. EhC01]|uniref:DUF6497 family protein n=1 Tax=Gymnodinialimonas phycosphaerae TaxID=2841589 RepID=A0A975TY40_9RHOB|nr:DUF6497 family protein [Gymnodinialimonas phycosphaerae]MBY4893166.1 DUF6497 family protein [Gymnodinialimonas phycosphaerae]OAN72642.1 hypothetical protein A8B78_19345 [Jannaschia sp. EhC01]
MLRNVLIVLTLAVAGSAAFLLLRGPSTPEICTTDEVLQAPSGHDLQLCDVAFEVQPNNDAWVIVRVVDEALVDSARAGHGDHDWACETWGLPALDKEPRPTRIIVQIMAAPFVRGEPAPGITQSIEAYSEENATCMWELL